MSIEINIDLKTHSKINNQLLNDWKCEITFFYYKTIKIVVFCSSGSSSNIYFLLCSYYMHSYITVREVIVEEVIITGRFWNEAS